ncbi:hypothetical protein PGB90_006211 [Kerria lacca]
MDFESVLKSTILEALIEKVTNIQNKGTNNAAVDAFIKIINSEPESAITAVRLITCKVQSPNEWEALQALYLLESCMECNCSSFQTEIGKFRFLNELIKLVSPKYLGNSTPSVIKNKIVILLKQWSYRYPKETKIKEAFDMLIKQGVVDADNNIESFHNSSNTSSTSNLRPNLYEEDEEKSKMLQKLLKSNKPSDLKAANHLIKTMVKEKEEKEDIRLIGNNVKLLFEMLSNVSSDSSHEEIELIKELKETCVNMKPTLAYLISCCNKTTKDSAELFELNDLLNTTLLQYHETMLSIKKSNLVNTRKISPTLTCNTICDYSTLLDLNSPIEDVPFILPTQPIELKVMKTESAINALEEVFNSGYAVGNNEKNEEKSSVESDYKSSGSSELFKDLNALGKSLLEFNVPSVTVPNNSTQNDLIIKSVDNTSDMCKSVSSDDQILSEDDDLVNGNENTRDTTSVSWNINTIPNSISNDSFTLTEFIEPLSDVYVPLIDIKTEGNEKYTAFEDPHGINVYIQLTKNKPRNDVSVFLVLSNSKRNEYISNFLFQPVVSKDCRLKLQSPSKCELPPFNPHIPVETIVQIMLIASMNKERIPLKFVISYNVQNEMITELGEVPMLPLR